MRIRKLNKTSKGFTLVEMLVVISIIALLAGVLFANLDSAQQKAQDAKRIAEKEKLKISDDAFQTLYEASEGDCRRAINLLQATASIALDINGEMINMIASTSKPAAVRVVLDYALAGDFINAREKLLEVMLRDSISGVDIIKAVQKEIWNLQIEPEIKVRLTEKTGEIEFRMTEGSDEFVQLQSLLASFVLAAQGKAT